MYFAWPHQFHFAYADTSAVCVTMPKVLLEVPSELPLEGSWHNKEALQEKLWFCRQRLLYPEMFSKQIILLISSVFSNPIFEFCWYSSLSGLVWGLIFLSSGVLLSRTEAQKVVWIPDGPEKMVFVVSVRIVLRLPRSVCFRNVFLPADFQKITYSLSLCKSEVLLFYLTSSLAL